MLEDLKKGFKAVDKFYTNKIREPVVNLIKSCNKVFKSVKHDGTLHNNNEHAVKMAFESNDEYTCSQISIAGDLIDNVGTNDNDIL